MLLLLGFLLVFNNFGLSANNISSLQEKCFRTEYSGEKSIFQKSAPAKVNTDHQFRHRKFTLFSIDPDKIMRRKKIISLILSFPLPFGILGLHRIYLGSKPYVPLVYIATIGGGFGIVPFIDFIVLLLEKDISKYINNPNVIMWAN